MSLRKGQTNSGSFKKGCLPFIKGKVGYFHHTDEAKKKIGEASKRNQKLNGSGFRKGMVSHNKGVPMTPEHKKKMQLANLGRIPWNKGEKALQPAWNKGVSPSEMTRVKISESLNKSDKVLRGEKSPFWKGGISSLKGYDSFTSQRRKARKKSNGCSHTLVQWEELKMQFGYMCLCCKLTEPEIILTEDHIIPLSKNGNDDISNIQPLCRSCNSRKFTKIINYKEQYV